jgi:hypothetical protein
MVLKNHKARSLLFGGLTILTAVMFATSAFLIQSAPTAHADAGSNQTLQSLKEIGTSVFVPGPSGLAGENLQQAVPGDDDHDQHTNAVYDNAPTTNPNPSASGVTSNNRGFSGFQGLNHFDQRTRDGGNAFSLEPPDQGLCVGNGKVVEAVNDVLVVFDKSGNRLTTPESMNTFFGLPYAINRTTGVAGPFLSDPKCYYDAATNRFFLTVLEEDAAPSVRTHTLIAVSQTGDPTGAWTDYSIDTTDDGQNGTPSNPNCPCLGDQPLIGTDAYGFYISNNEFPEFVAGFNGTQLYAMSKWQLAAAAAHGSSTLPTIVHINVGAIPTPDVGGIWYSLQPATTPNQDWLTLANGGTEYFLSALQFGPAPLDNRIAAWALTNTRSLNRGNPNVTLLNTVISSETYGLRADGSLTATQKAGDYPLGQFLGQPKNQLNANDDRMNQVVYAAGLLYSGVNTVVGDGSRVGMAYFMVLPYVTSSHGSLSLHARMVKQGYVSVANNNVFFPSIGVNRFGQGVMTFTLSGPDYYPTSAYVTVNPVFGAGSVHIAGAGVGPADGFTGYASFGGNGVERWGDYSAAVADSDGSIWFASEYIAQSCTVAEWSTDSTCGGTRTQLANWSTFVGHVSGSGLLIH